MQMMISPMPAGKPGQSNAQRERAYFKEMARQDLLKLRRARWQRWRKLIGLK